MDRAGTAVRPGPVAAVDRRAAADVGRRAALELHFGVRRGRTVITEAYAEPPYRVAAPFDRDGELHLIVTMTAPGIFGGDEFRQRIVVDEGARVRLTSQSAMQVHASPEGQPARLHGVYEVAAAASLVCHWDPMIPFAAARVANVVSIDLAEDARLVWSDAMMAGRAARGERWAFERLQHELSIRRAARLSYLERYCLEPARDRLDAPWTAAGSTYLGTTLASAPSLRDAPGAPPRADVTALQQELDAEGDVTAGLDRLDAGLVLARLVSPRGASFHRARTRLLSAAEHWIDDARRDQALAARS